MKKISRIIIALFLTAILLSLSACRKGQTADLQKPETAKEQTEESTAQKQEKSDEGDAQSKPADEKANGSLHSDYMLPEVSLLG